MPILLEAAAMAPDFLVANANETGTLSSSPGPYEMNVKIMIAAIVVLLSVILFIFGLHLYAKWFWNSSQFGLRRRRSQDEEDPYAAPLDVDDHLFNNPAFGVDKAFIDALPTFVFRSSDEKRKLSGISDSCAVCISEFQDGDEGRLLPKCSHAFHSSCVDVWLRCHTTCPLCRTAIVSLPWEARAKVDPIALDLLLLQEAAAAAMAAAAASRESILASSATASQGEQHEQGFKQQECQLVADSSSASASCSSMSVPRSPKSRWKNLRRMLSRDRKIVPQQDQLSTSDQAPEAASVVVVPSS